MQTSYGTTDNTQTKHDFGLRPNADHTPSRNNANQKTPEQREELRKKMIYAFRMWQSCRRLAGLQVDVGGAIYSDQPQRCMSWRLQDNTTRYLLD